MAPTKPHILPIIVVAQFFCTSVWFAGNAIADKLSVATGLGPETAGYVLSSVQFGFIIGTIVFALFMFADRYSPSKVFLICALAAAVCNLSLTIAGIGIELLLLTRFATGFFLAGIYPVGMKIASDYYEKGLGKALGFLVGALVLGTAFPYFTAFFEVEGKTDHIILITSSLTVAGGVFIGFFVPNGPFRKPTTQLNLASGISLFKIASFRKAAFGYFGHMWELYAFWAFIPLAIATYNETQNEGLSESFWAFIIIGVGAVSCVLGGSLSKRYGSALIAKIALTISGICCIVSPLLFELPRIAFLSFYCIWGMAVIADSPQFSTLVARSTPITLRATGLTLVNSIGFSISIISIQLLTHFRAHIPANFLFLILSIGPIFGLFHMFKKRV